MTATAGRLTIDLDAIARNWRMFAGLGRGQAAAVVKADAYGLGAAKVAPYLWQAGARRFFVAHLAEGESLRQILPDADIFVLNGLGEGTAGRFAAAGLCPVLNSLAEVREWAAARPGPAALHLDSGMHRLGLDPEETRALAAEPGLLNSLALTLVMTHAACADDPAHPMTAMQVARFEAQRALLPPLPASFANSASAFHGEVPAYDLIRPGIGLYGGQPVAGRALPLSPVITLDVPILQVRDVDVGESVGYGAAYRAATARRVAVVALGYADGFPRSLSGQGAALLGGAPAPVIGRISMDLTTLDVTGIDPALARRGAMVRFFADPGLDDLAAMAGTISYEVLTRLGHRFSRHYIGAAA